jgi:hypothetical protein
MPPRVPGIFVKAAPVKSSRHLSCLLFEYLDETTKAAHVDPAIALLNYGRVGYAEAVERKLAPLRAGEDYVPSSNPKIRLFGLVRQAMGRYFPDIDRVAPAVLMDELLRWWLAATEGRKVVASNAVFSLHPEISAGLSKRRISVDDVLFANAARALEIYANRYYPGDEIGWVGGVHHDRKHPHLHVVIFPLTSGRKRLDLSPLIAISDGKGGKVRVDFQGTLARAYHDQCAKTSEVVFGRPGESPVEPATVAAEVATGLAAAFAGRRISGGTAPSAEAFREGIKIAEAMSTENLKAILGVMAAESRQPAGPEFPENLREFQVTAGELREAIQQRREAIAANMREILQTRADALRPRYGAVGLGRHLGYSQESHPPAGTGGKSALDTWGPMIQEQTDRTFHYHSLVRAVGQKSAGATSSETSLRLVGAAGLATVLAAQKSGRMPFFLPEIPQKSPEVYRLLRADRSRLLAERFAEIMARNNYELRPFTIEEFGNKSVSPYRVSTGPAEPPTPKAPPPDPEDEIEDFVALSQHYYDNLRVAGPQDGPAPAPSSPTPSF